MYTQTVRTPANPITYALGQKDERLALIDRAAAIETLNEPPVISLDEAACDAFVAALDAPNSTNG